MLLSAAQPQPNSQLIRDFRADFPRKQHANRDHRQIRLLQT